MFSGGARSAPAPASMGRNKGKGEMGASLMRGIAPSDTGPMTPPTRQGGGGGEWVWDYDRMEPKPWLKRRATLDASLEEACPNVKAPFSLFPLTRGSELAHGKGAQTLHAGSAVTGFMKGLARVVEAGKQGAEQAARRPGLLAPAQLISRTPKVSVFSCFMLVPLISV